MIYLNSIKNRGLKSISLATHEGRKARELWTAELIKKLRGFPLEFAIFAGFIPLCNITEKIPCLNVHPGDLTVKISWRKNFNWTPRYPH